jgi:hypothetical protein
MSSSGVISGTPTVSGTFNYTVTVTDSKGNKGTLSCSMTVTAPVSATCLCISPMQGVAITSSAMVGSGGSGSGYTFSATGLPAGLSMSSSGVISGTPTVSGTFNYTVTITDGKGNKGTLSCSMTVAARITATCLCISPMQGVAITSSAMSASGGSGGYTFSATGLPAGLSMSSSGVISGTPTVSGTFNYTVTIKDSQGHTATVCCSMTVAAPITATCLCISPKEGVAITSSAMSASGGSGGYTFSATGLPAGLTMSSSGVISGTPTASGTFKYTVTIKDSQGHTATVCCSMTVAAKCASILNPNATYTIVADNRGYDVINSSHPGTTEPLSTSGRPMA